MPAETPAERGRRLVDGHDDGHDDLDDANDDDHDDDHDGSARRVDRITRPRRSRVSSVCGRSATPPAVRNAAAGPSTRWCRTARRGSRPRQRRERYCSRVREPRLAFGSLRYMPAAAAAGSFLYIGVFQQSCRPAYGSPSRFSGVNVLGASAPPVISTCRVNTPVRRGSRHFQECSAERLPEGMHGVYRGLLVRSPVRSSARWSRRWCRRVSPSTSRHRRCRASSGTTSHRMGERDRVLGPHPASLVAVRQESRLRNSWGWRLGAVLNSPGKHPFALDRRLDAGSGGPAARREVEVGLFRRVADRASEHRWVTDAGRAPRGVAGGALVMSPGVRAGRR